ncbi:MJ0042-type zinc finger domain-containing protein [Bremerella sp. T1]|uniref:MJ0042-type zinc finger domain-containing protein n=1 Tax=Bremerella sp. TYQ1 TaxID=3119568 RepID=UPI001CCCA53F|nr:MJ0042-type zinc finger domain-containing protein [Bremerella volcania]UBM36469.1 hypothetical protein LA756_00880 [Bremerella volcania]
MHLKCPHCSTVLNVTSPAGTQVQCPTCQGVFVVPQVTPQPAAPQVGPVITPKTPGSKPPKKKAPANANQADGTEGAEGEEELEGREIPWDLILKITKVVVIPMCLAVVLFLVLVGAGILEIGSDEIVDDTPYVNDGVANSGNQIQDVMEAGEKGDIYVKWIPAKNSATMQGFKVKVNHVDWGEVRGRDEAGELVTSNGRPYMNVYLELANRSDKTFQFKSWYGNEFTTQNGAIRTAQLSDDDKNMYYPLKFDDLADLKWWTPSKTFDPLEEGTDCIVFDVPEDFDPNKVENLYLDLPGEAVGQSGSYRFKIPKSMIQGL